MGNVREHPATCPTCGTLNPHKGRRDLLELVHVAYQDLAKLARDARVRCTDASPLPGFVDASTLQETLDDFIAGALALADRLNREMYAARGGCLKCWDALTVQAAPRCGVCGELGPGCGPDGTRCRRLGCTGVIA